MEANGGKIAVLCIEDEHVVAEFIESLLDKETYTFSNIQDGQEALDYLLSIGARPDIILLDYILPSLNGIEILKALKANHKKYPVIFLTSDKSLDTAVAAMKEGAHEFLAKSSNLPAELNIKIEKTYQEFKKSENYERQLLLKTEEMERFFTVVTDLLCIADRATGKFIHLNKAWEETLGYTTAELINKAYTDFIHPDDLEVTQALKGELNETGRISGFVNRYRCKDGTYKFIEWNTIANKSGTSYSSGRDITERMLSEQAVKESESRFRSIFETANAGIFFTNKSGQIILTNEVFREMLGYSFKELYHLDFNEFTLPEDLGMESQLFDDLMDRKTNQYRIEKRYLSKTGQTIWVDLALAVIRDDHGDPLYFVGVVKNISVRKQYEQQLKDNNDTKDKFFSIIAHDLRNQFSAISGMSEVLMLKRQGTLTETERDKYVGLLNDSARDALALLEDLLEWSRSQLNKVEMRPQWLNLRELAGNILKVVKYQADLKQISLVCDIGSEHTFFADENMMNVILRNLLNNAVKFTPAGGEIVFSARFINNEDVISVKDSGVGMAQDVVEKLFKIDKAQSTPGTAREKGTGLGLILCNEFIERHGGTIAVKSEINKGSEFIITLPVK